MIGKAADRDLVARYVEKVRETVDESRLTAATPADSVDEALPPTAVAPSTASSAVYLSRDPAPPVPRVLGRVPPPRPGDEPDQEPRRGAGRGPAARRAAAVGPGQA